MKMFNYQFICYFRTHICFKEILKQFPDSIDVIFYKQAELNMRIMYFLQ